MRFSTNPEMILKVEALVSLLRSASIGETIDHARIKAIVGEDSYYALLQRARKVAEDDGVAKYAIVRGVGVKRIAITEYAGIGSEARKSLGRKARRAFKRLSNIKTNEIEPAVRQRIDAERSVLGAIAVMAQDTSIAKVEPHTQTGPQVASRLFDLFRQVPQ